eukprot:gene2867-4710_t
MMIGNNNSAVKTVHLPEDIYKDFKEIDHQRKQNSEYQSLINSLHEKTDLNQEEKTKLCGLYKTSIETSRKEETMLQNVLVKLQTLIENTEKDSPKKKFKSKNTTISSYLEDDEEMDDEELQQGDRVASRVDGENFWILSKFVSMIDKNKYEIEDEDIDENNTKIRKRYRLNKSRIIPLSKNFQQHQVLEKGTKVLAVYPETTTFYSGVVYQIPKSHSNLKFKWT